MRRFVMALMVLVVVSLGSPVSVAGAGKSIVAKTCQQSAALGYPNRGRCVKAIVHRPAVAATLGLFEANPDGGVFACPAIGGCLLGVEGEGLRPGSDVTVADGSSTFSAVLPVDGSGRILVEGIFPLGACTAEPGPLTFVATGTSSSGAGVASAPVTIDLLAYLPPCA